MLHNSALGTLCPGHGCGWPSAITPTENRDWQALRLISKHNVHPALAAEVAALAWPVVPS